MVLNNFIVYYFLKYFLKSISFTRLKGLGARLARKGLSEDGVVLILNKVQY